MLKIEAPSGDQAHQVLLQDSAKGLKVTFVESQTQYTFSYTDFVVFATVSNAIYSQIECRDFVKFCGEVVCDTCDLEQEEHLCLWFNLQAPNVVEKVLRWYTEGVAAAEKNKEESKEASSDEWITDELLVPADFEVPKHIQVIDEPTHSNPDADEFAEYE